MRAVNRFTNFHRYGDLECPKFTVEHNGPVTVLLIPHGNPVAVVDLADDSTRRVLDRWASDNNYLNRDRAVTAIVNQFAATLGEPSD